MDGILELNSFNDDLYFWVEIVRVLMYSTSILSIIVCLGFIYHHKKHDERTTVFLYIGLIFLLLASFIVACIYGHEIKTISHFTSNNIPFDELTCWANFHYQPISIFLSVTHVVTYIFVIILGIIDSRIKYKVLRKGKEIVNSVFVFCLVLIVLFSLLGIFITIADDALNDATNGLTNVKDKIHENGVRDNFQKEVAMYAEKHKDTVVNILGIGFMNSERFSKTAIEYIGYAIDSLNVLHDRTDSLGYLYTETTKIQKAQERHVEKLDTVNDSVIKYETKVDEIVRGYKTQFDTLNNFIANDLKTKYQNISDSLKIYIEKSIALEGV